MKIVIVALLLCIPIVIAGCGDSSSEDASLDDPKAIIETEGAEPVLREEGP